MVTLEQVVAKAKKIVELAEQGGFDEYEGAVTAEFGSYLTGSRTLKQVGAAYDEWLETLEE